jgi:hypothetical protein
MGWACGKYGRQGRYIGYKGLVGPEGRIPLGIPKHTWDENVKIHLQEVGFEGMDCIAVG